MINKILFIVLCLLIIVMIFTAIFTVIILIKSRPKIDIVISRYNENIDWIKNLDLRNFRNIYIYNKGSVIPIDLTSYSSKIKIMKLSNVGRESHTYLYHIVQNYNNLANITIFLPASCDMENKKKKTENTITTTLKMKDSVFFCNVDMMDIKNDIYDFAIKEYQSTNENNKSVNKESNLYPSPEKPYGKWFEHNFGNIKIKGCTYHGIFAVSKKHIYNRPVEFYKNLLKYLDSHSNPEVGHYFERSWIAIFHPIPDTCKYKE